MDERQCFDYADDALAAAMRSCDDAGLSAHDTSCVMLAATVILCNLLESTAEKTECMSNVWIDGHDLAKNIHNLLIKELTKGDTDS